MPEDDVTMGGTGALETVKADPDSLPGGQLEERTNTSTPVPQIVSDIIRPNQQGTTGRYPSKHEQGMRQASSLAMGGIKQGLNALHSHGPPPTPSNTRFAVVINSSPAKAHALASSHTFPTPKMQKKAATTASSREQRVKTEPRSTAAGFTTFDEQLATTRSSPQGQQQRGRPKGWKPGMTYAEMRAVLGGSGGGEAAATRRKAATSSSAQQGGGGGEPKRRGRPPRAPEATAREHYLQQNPTYTHFCCEWVEPSGQGRKERRCPAELQNLETLRRHVYIAHEDHYFTNDGSFVCRWGRCGEKKTETDAGASAFFGVVLADQDAFDAHVEREHFRPFAWHVGDGVQNRGNEGKRQEVSAQAQGKDTGDQPLPAYLFKDGVQVTPSIRDQRLEDDQRRRERRRKLRRLLIQKDENAPDEEEYILQTLGLAQAPQRDGEGRFC
ncbi:hypothetical protein SLS62_007009 [Diatrype stigma]|uniref:C2H2-type domain-containing protein n=1 Tax=Diatrype stigma TaxID=117547 RepID=A0AAN9YR67_9PEZI